ncbi:MAG: hypothetical protein M1837_000341 [Sclerophora amabilis]|nr:MAG: hypothetical protein M1837_000341 [Sclerophora amabilis]
MAMPLPQARYTRASPGPRTSQALHTFNEACATGHLDEVVDFIEGHRPLKDFLSQGLATAVRQGEPEVAEYLLRRGAVISKAITQAAIITQSLPVFQVLLNYGWDINSWGVQGRTPLLNAVRDEAAVRWFLDHGADPNFGPPLNSQSDFPIANSGSVLMAAASGSSVAVFDLLLERGAKMELCQPLHAAAMAEKDGERISMMTHLLSLGLDVNGSDDSRGVYRFGTPLHHASRCGGIEKVRFLLAHGADPEIRCRRGTTVLEEAYETGYRDIIALLRQVTSARQTGVAGGPAGGPAAGAAGAAAPAGPAGPA